MNKILIIFMIVLAAFEDRSLALDDQKVGFVGRLEWSEQGLQKAFQFALDHGLPFLEKKLVDHPLPDRLLKPIQPDANKCRIDQLKHMWVNQAWKDCWGVPEWLLTSWSGFFLGSAFKSHRPRPSSIKLSHMVFQSLKPKSAKISCNKNKCQVHFIIEHFDIQTNADVFDLNTSEKLLNAENINLRLRSGMDGVYPSLTLPFSIDSTKNGLDRLVFDEEGIDADFPQGSFAVGFASDKDPVSYVSDGVFFIGDKSKYDHYKKNFEKESDFYLFLSLAKLINEKLSYSDTSIFYLKKFFLHIFKKKALIEIKQLFAKVFEPKNLALPDMKLQHYIDDTKIHLVFDLLSLNIKTLTNMALDNDSCDMKSYEKTYKKMKENFSDFTETVLSSPREDHAVLLDELILSMKNLYQTEKKYKHQCHLFIKKDFFLSKNAWHEMYEKILDLRKDLFQMVKDKKIPILIHLDAADSLYGLFPLSIVLKTNMFPDLKAVPSTLPKITDEAFDVSLQLSLDFINEVLKTAYLNGHLNFCMNLSKDNKTCVSGSEDMWVYFNNAPKVVWNDQIKKYILIADDIKSKLRLLGHGEIMRIKLTEHPYINISFLIEPHEEGLLIHPDFTASTIKSTGKGKILRWLKVLKSVLSIHPIAAHLVLGLKVEKDFEEKMSRVFPTPDIRLGDSFYLPKIKLIKVESYPDFLKFYASFT